MNASTLTLASCKGAFQATILPCFCDVILGMKAFEPIATNPTVGTVYLMIEFDEQWALEGLRRLDSQAIGAIYDRYFPEVYRYVLYRVNEETTAEDIASDVFMRLLESTRRKKGPQTNLHGWLIATASNAVND